MPDPASQQEAVSKYRTGLNCKITGHQGQKKRQGVNPAKMKRDIPKWEAPAALGLVPAPAPLALCLVTKLVFLDLPVQRRQPDIEQAGRFRLISPGVVEDPLYMQFLYARQVERRQRPRRPDAGNLQIRRQVIDGKLITVREDDSSFDNIF